MLLGVILWALGPSAVGCACAGGVVNLTEPRGVIASPNFPGPFPTPIHCRWRIDTSRWGSSNVTVYLTQLFLRSGLKFTDYDDDDDKDEDERDSCSTREVTMYDLLHSHNYTSSSRYLEIELKLERLEGNHLRVEDALLDVYGFNITYELGATPKDTCNVVNCSFLGHCLASADFETYKCSCFDEYYGHDCSFGPLCNDTENPCKNGATCRSVGASRVLCDKSTSSEIQAEYEDLDDDAPCSGKCTANPQQMSACEYCENNPNCLMQCNYGHRQSVCDYPSHYSLIITAKARSYNADTSKCLGIISPISLETLILTSLRTRNVTADAIEIECSNLFAVVVHLMIPKESREEIDSIKNTPTLLFAADNAVINSTSLSLSEEPLLSLLNISITAGQQIRSPGDDFNITCVAQGSRFLTFSWFKNNNRIEDEFNYRISTPTYLSAGYYASVLRIFNATLETRGLYTCQASDFNSYLQQCKCLEVFVLAEWTGHVELKKEVVEKHSNLTLSCSSDPYLFYFWKKNNAVFNMSHSEFWEDVSPIGSVLKAIRIEESVNFTCLMAGPTGIDAIEYQEIVDNTRCADDDCEKICFRDKILSCEAKDNCALLTDCEEPARINLGCVTENFTNKMQWFNAVINMTNLLVARDNETSLDQFLASFNLTVHKYLSVNGSFIEGLDTTPCNRTHFKVQFLIKEEDWNFSREVVTECMKVVKNSRELRGSAWITFFKMDELVLKDLRSDRSRVFENDDFQLSCLAFGNGANVSFEWYKDGVRIDPYFSNSTRRMWYRVSSHSNWKSSNNVSILHTEHIAILGVLSASKLNQGWYTCRVSNGRNQFCKSVKISIVSPPQVTIEPLSVTTRKEGNIDIRCVSKSACEVGQSRYEWTENGVSLNTVGSNNSKRFSIQNMIGGGSHLKLLNIQQSAEYSCQLICTNLRSAIETSQVCVIPNEEEFVCHDNGWPSTAVGCSVRKKCPVGYVGKYIIRECSETSFKPFNGSLCVRSEIARANQTLNQLVMGYQNGNIEDLLISYNNFLSKNLTFLSGENVDLFFGFMDDSCNLVESIFSSHSHSLEVDLTTVMKMSFGIFSHLLRHFSSIDSTQVLLSVSNTMHPWIFMYEKYLVRKDGHFNFSSPNFYAVSRAIDHVGRKPDFLTEIRSSDGSLGSPLVGVNFQKFQFNDSSFQEPSVSVILFRNSSLSLTTRILQDFQKEGVILPEAESIIVSVASNEAVLTVSDKVNLTMDWKLLMADRWDVKCALIQRGEFPLNFSVCVTNHVARNIHRCSCSKLGTFSLVRTFKPQEPSCTLTRAIQLGSILATLLTGFIIAINLMKKLSLQLFLKLFCSLVLLWYLLQVFFSSNTSMLGLSCLQILIISLIASQSLVIYLKTNELLNIYKYPIVLAAVGFPALLMLSVGYAVRLANNSNSGAKITVLWLLLIFNFLQFALFFCLRHQLKSQYSGKKSTVRKELYSCTVLMLLMGAVELFQIWSSSSSTSSIVDSLCICCCLLLSLAFLWFHRSTVTMNDCKKCLCSFLGSSCFKCKFGTPETGNEKQVTSRNEVEEQVPLTALAQKRELRDEPETIQNLRNH
ncbi:unnamed protein product [Bemisia tabaci]|uniref:Uncharacterized protein n=1 Tax=Bemisia tabaci TaxID=7038 RepID=A0A9P0ADY1_BEMTA|nr:unnamed protein product [Bemisia tabaci]